MKAGSETRLNDAAERDAVEAAQRDPSRFAELYERNCERVYAYVARRVHGREEAEDITSEVFHRALANLPRFEWRGAPFAAWLITIAMHAIADRMKHAARERAALTCNEPEQVPSSEEIEHRARLFRLVLRLPMDQRRVIVMRFAEEKPIREIAQELGRSEGAIKQLQFRGLRTLRALLKDADV